MVLNFLRKAREFCFRCVFGEISGSVLTSPIAAFVWGHALGAFRRAALVRRVLRFFGASLPINLLAAARASSLICAPESMRAISSVRSANPNA